MARPSITHHRREQIAAAMVVLLARHGVHGATMRALASETRLTQGVLHYHFPAKPDMVIAALGALEAGLRDRLERAAGRDPLDALVDALLAPQEEPAASPHAVAAWVAIGDAAQTDAQIRVAYGDALARLHEAFRSRIAVRAATRGRTLGTGEAEALAGAAVSQVEGAWRIGRGAPWAMPSGVAASTLRQLLGAVLGSEVTGDYPAAPQAAASRPAPLPEPSVRLRARERRWWEALVATSPVALPPSVWAAVAAAYTARGRHYHTLEHLAELAGLWREIAAGPGWQDPRSTWLALLFHDAVQERTGPPGEDEDRSAALLAALVPDTAAAERLIRLTASHGADRTGLDADAAHFLDADLAILGAAPTRFDRYTSQIAAEYASIVPMELFRAGRAAFLARMLTQPRIFASDWFHAHRERRARANLRRALDVAG